MVVQKNLTSSLNQTYDVDDTSMNPYFMVVYSLVFLVSFKLSNCALLEIGLCAGVCTNPFLFLPLCLFSGGFTPQWLYIEGLSLSRLA